jgi:DNA replicative helicase MCM subunit Mcm2 (Cdc46/Mcm family)
MPVPATVRVLGSAVKMAIAFARVRLQDEVRQPEIDRAKALGRRLVKQNWDGEQFDAAMSEGEPPKSQAERIRRIEETLQEAEGELETEEIADMIGLENDVVKDQLLALKKKSRTNLINPTSDTWRWV